MTALTWTCVWLSRNRHMYREEWAAHWRECMMLRDGGRAVSGSRWYSKTAKQLRTVLIWIIRTSSTTGSLLPWGRGWVQALPQGRAFPSLMVTFLGCSSHSMWSGSQLAPLGPWGPPCTCAPDPEDRQLRAGDGRRCDKPELPSRPLARRTEPVTDR